MLDSLVADLRHIDDLRVWPCEVPIVINLVPIERLPFAHHQVCRHLEPEVMGPFDPVVCHQRLFEVLRDNQLPANKLRIVKEVITKRTCNGISSYWIIR